MPSIEEIRWGKELAKRGVLHVAYVQTLGEKEYEFDHEPSDRDVFEAMVLDLEEHKKTCAGCGRDMLEGAKEKVRRLSGR